MCHIRKQNKAYRDLSRLLLFAAKSQLLLLLEQTNHLIQLALFTTLSGWLHALRPLQGLQRCGEVLELLMPLAPLTEHTTTSGGGCPTLTITRTRNRVVIIFARLAILLAMIIVIDASALGLL